VTHFKRFIATFLLFHVIFAILLLLGYKFFTEFTNEMFAYLFWFVILFGIFAMFIQSLVFSILSYKWRLNKYWFFIIAFVIELVLANVIVIYSNGGGGFTEDLLNDIRDHNSWDNIAGSLIIHMAILMATLLTALIRSVPVVDKGIITTPE
jgi:hypothetical protein